MDRLAARFPLAVVVALTVAAAGALWALDPDRRVTQYGLQSWTTAQGLPSNAVNAVLQSKDGYLWLGTEDGLVRFDGLQFSLFDRRTTPAFKVNDVTGLVETPGGTLYAATNGGGILRYRDGIFSRFGREEGLGDERVWAICGDGGEGLWVGTPSRELYRLEDGKFRAATQEFGLTLDGVGALRAAPPGSYGMEASAAAGVWIAHGRALHLYAGGTLTAHALPGPFSDTVITAVLPDERGRLWVGTNLGVVRLEKGGYKAFAVRQGLLNERIFFLARDRDGNTWVGSYGGGLARIAPDDRLEVLTTANGLADDRPLCFCEDRDGGGWVGTRGGGLNRLTDGPATPFTKVEGLTSDDVYTVLQDREGALWLGTAGGGLNRIAGGRVSAWGVREGLSSNGVYALFQDREGTLWVGTGDGALNRYDGRRFHSEVFQPEGRRFKVACIVEDGRGRLLVGTRGGGLWTREGGTLVSVSDAKGPTSWGVYAMLPDPDGSLWLGTSEGLYHLVGGKFVHLVQEPDLGREKIFGLCKDGSGTLWLATYSGGLIGFRDGKARRITGADGLDGDTFYQVIDDGRGRLWLTGNKGIVVVALKELEAFVRGNASAVRARVIGIEDGLRTLECNGGAQPAGCLARDGRIWFPTARGAVSLDPSNTADREEPPGARVEAVLVNGQPLPSGADDMPRGAGALEFQFSVPSLQNPGRLQVRYRLDGVDPDWRDAGTRRTAYYTNVPSGRFVFRVKGGHGRAFGPEATAAIHLTPPWILHPLFLAALGLLIAALVYSAYRLRVGLLKRRGRLLEETVAERTAELTAEKDRVKGLEERYRAVVEAQTEMICRFAPDGTLLFVNGALGRLWGRNSEELTGESLYTFFPPAVRQWTRDALASFTPAEPFRLMEQRVPAADGDPRVHQWSVSAFFDGDGEVTGFQAVGRDVTQLRRLREQLVQAQKMEAIGLLAGGVAHDFNNLLQAMLSAAGTLRRTCSTCAQGEAVVREIEQDIQRAAQLTRQLLLFARKETARPEPLDLNAVVRGVEGLLRRFIRENIAFELLLCDEALPVRADLSQLEQAIVNLVVNACDAMPGGGRLVLATGLDGGSSAWLCVRDSGPGVSEELRGRIFEPFFTTKGSEQGTGLGLSVVLGIVQQNGGAIEVGSAPEGGAAFSVTLPLMSESPRAPHPPSPDGPRPHGNADHLVLLVEDATGVRDWLGEALSLLGYRVTPVATVAGALERLAERAYDLVLSDVLLPDGSGVDVARHIATLSSPPALILVSGYSRDDLLRREVMAGNVRFLQKPFGLDALEREMAAALAEAAQAKTAGA